MYANVLCCSLVANLFFQRPMPPSLLTDRQKPAMSWHTTTRPTLAVNGYYSIVPSSCQEVTRIQ